MQTDRLIKIAKIIADINEINDVLNAQFFDRCKAESIIHKHNDTDPVVAAVNSPLNPDVRPFYELDDDAIKANLCAIRNYFQLKLVEEQNNG